MIAEILTKHIKNFTMKDLAKGEIVYHEGSEPTDLYLLEEGLIGLFHISENGHESLFRIFSKGSIFGHRACLAEEPYHASSVTLSKARIKTIPKSEVESVCSTHPDILMRIAKELARDLGQAELKIADFQDKSANARISESLVFLKLRHPEHVWTRKAIADFSGSTFETVTRVMTILSKEGLIEKHGRDFTIPNPETLLNFISTNF